MSPAITTIEPSHYLQYLPSIYQEDNFLGRFLRVFEDSLEPDEILLDNLVYILDPRYVPPDILFWLAALIDLTLDENWDLLKRRQLIHEAAWLFRWRGTRKGLLGYLKIYLGENAMIDIQEDYKRNHVFHVKIRGDGLSDTNQIHLHMIIEVAKPAHTTYTLEVI